MNPSCDPLIAAVIHDAKNALMALDTRLAEAQRRPASADFAGARATTVRIANQLSELLTLYRAHNGQLRLSIDDHDLADFIDDLMAELGPLPAGITLAVDHTAARTIGAWAFDAYLVRLALLDALRNTLRQTSTQVRLTLDKAAHRGICFTVADDGPGFPESVLTGMEDVASVAGSGLGLSFARLIAERHVTPAGQHGRIELANGPGATFRLYLP